RKRSGPPKRDGGQARSPVYWSLSPLTRALLAASLAFLIHDRDTKFSRACDGIVRSEGIEIVRTPIQAPNANACAERWVGSVRRASLDRLLFCGRRQLEHVLCVSVRHLN